MSELLGPEALRRQVDKLITTPTIDGGQLDVAAVATRDDAGVEAQLTAGGGWWSAAAWGQWFRTRGWSVGGVGSLRWGSRR